MAVILKLFKKNLSKSRCVQTTIFFLGNGGLVGGLGRVVVGCTISRHNFGAFFSE